MKHSEPLLNATPMAPAALPVAQVIGGDASFDFAATLGSASGLLIRERFFWSQVFCGACEKKTQFKVAAWDPEMPGRLTDEHFVAQSMLFEILEESTCLQRYCCHQWRELELGVFSPTDRSQVESGMKFNAGWPAQTEPHLTMQRPFRCSMPLCCFMPCPQELTMTGPGGVSHGKIVQDWKIWNCCWPCDQYMDAFDAAGAHRLTIQTPTGCGSWCTNCCAPSCFNPVHTAFIMAPGSSVPVGYIENQWPGCNTRGLCMANSGADNYVLKFPPKASTGDKALVLGGWALSNFMFWEKRGNQK